MGVLQIIQDSIETHGVLGIPHLRNLRIVSFLTMFSYVFYVLFFLVVIFDVDMHCVSSLLLLSLLFLALVIEPNQVQP